MSQVEFFTEKDFWDLGLVDIRRNEAARRCNEKLNQKLGPVVYGAKQGPLIGWGFDQQGIIPNHTTHKAYLFNIEEIKKEQSFEELAQELVRSYGEKMIQEIIKIHNEGKIGTKE